MQFIKLHVKTSDETQDPVSYVKAKAIEVVESDGNGGSFVITPTSSTAYRESPDEVMKLMDEQVQKMVSAQVDGVLKLIDAL